MTLTGTIIEVHAEQSGVTSAGKAWRRRQYVISTEGERPRKVAFEVRNDKISSLGLQLGARVAIQFDIDSREYNGKWYTSLTAWDAQEL